MHVQQVILSVIGVPGALLAGWMVEIPVLGRKGTLAISTSSCLSLHILLEARRLLDYLHHPYSHHWRLPLCKHDSTDVERAPRLE